MGPFLRFIRALLQHPWAFPFAATISGFLLAGGVVGWILHWSFTGRLLYWAVIWAIVALGARAMINEPSA